MNTASSPQAGEYARIKRRLMLADWFGSLLLLLFVQMSGLSGRMAAWVRAVNNQEALVIAGFLVLFGVAAYGVMLPLHFYSGFVIEHRFALSRMSLRDWCVREAKHLAVSGIIGLFLIEGLYALLRAAPRTWPFWATVGWVGFSVILARVFPTFLLPIFYKTTPLNQPELAKRLLALCAKVKLPALGVFRFALGAETRKANAALAGLGRTRRVLLSDTLINDFTVDEIEGVLAHELAHHHYRHITKHLMIGVVAAWFAFSLTQVIAGTWVGWFQLNGLSDIAGFPALMVWFSLLGFLAMPLQNALSRHFEWQSDRFATATTQPQAFADALRRLARLNLADPAPPRWVVWWFYDHPPITERIEAADGIVG